MARATHRVAARLVLAAFGSTWAITACQAVPATAPARLATKPRAAAADREPVSLAAPMAAEPHVVVRRHAMAPTTVAVDPAALLSDKGGMFVSAAAGGHFCSADGAVEATIPPGALDRDAVVRFEALPTADLPAFPAYLPGMRVAADLGGASIRPGQALMVGARLDATTIARLRTMAPGQDLSALGVTSGPDGGAVLAMPMRGPSLGVVPVPAEPPQPGAWSTVEFGGPLAAAAPARRLMAAATGPLKRIPAKMPTTYEDFHQLELMGVIGCDITGICFGNNILSNLYDGEPLDPAACGLAFEPPAPVPTPAPVGLPAPGVGVAGLPPAAQAPVALPCRVTWFSDDPRVHGQPVPGALVRFRLAGLPGVGPAEVVTDAAGRASTFAPPGWKAFPTAEKAPGRALDAGAEVTVRAGMPAVELQLQKASPVIALQLVSLGGVELPDAVTIDFEVGGRPGVLEVPLAAVEATRRMANFTVKLEGDEPVPFEITGLRLADGRAPLALPRPVDVTWNGVYPTQLEFAPEVPFLPK